MLKLHTYWVVLSMIVLAVPRTGAQELTLRDIFFSGNYRAHGSGHFSFLHRSSGYSQLQYDNAGHQLLTSFDIATGNPGKTFLDTRDLEENLRFDGYEFSADDEMVLLVSEEERIYRHSTQGFYYTYDITSGELKALQPERKQMYPLFSPDNRKVGFIVENDLFYRDLSSGEVHRITTDGRVNHIINGRPDWVYEEEFTIERMYEWSEDGRYMLFVRFDESEVPEFSYMRYGPLYPAVETFKYPRAGEVNSEVTLRVFDTQTDSLYTLDIPFEYEYIPRIIPAGDGFAFMLLNRHQNHQRIVYFDPGSGDFELVFEYQHDQYIDEPTVFSYLGDGRYMIANDRDGYLHIYAVSTGSVEAVTGGEYEVTDFYGLDDDGWIYYQASVAGPELRHIFKKNMKTGETVRLVHEDGYHEAEFTGDFKYFVHTWSAQNSPDIHSVHDNNGALVRMIEDNAELRKRMSRFWRDREFFEIDAREYDIPAWIIKPPDFDPEKKYPVLNFVYGGPGRQRVRNEYLGTFDLWFQLLAQQGYIIVCTDNRGTPGKGSAYLKAHYLQLGTIEVEDQMIVIDYLKSLPFVDGDRIGYYGWSYGGYMALLMLFQGQGAVRAALSVAPVTDWRFYDTIYTERFMRTPSENPGGYRKGSAIEAVSNWKSGKLFLAHGTADDNVHFQNTAELVKEMNGQGKHYDLYIYPDGAHGMGGYRNIFHLFEKMTDFILENL